LGRNQGALQDPGIYWRGSCFIAFSPMSGRTDTPGNNSHPGHQPLAAFLLCLVFGPLGLLYLGVIETVIVGSIYLAGIAAFYWIWAPMLPEFIGFSLVLLAFAAKKCAGFTCSGFVQGNQRQSYARVWPMAVALLIDLGMLCIGGAILKQFRMAFGKVHILGIFLSLCISLPVGFLFFKALRENILRRISR
jgi:hypothetical protein